LEGSGNSVSQIVFVTANSLEPLLEHHAAVFRNGRIDNKIKLGYADKGMAKSLFCKFFSTCSSGAAEKIEALSDQFSGSLLEDTWSMAHLEGYLLQHDENIHSAVSEFGEWQDKQKREA
jgi:chaperone BCS1